MSPNESVRPSYIPPVPLSFSSSIDLNSSDRKKGMVSNSRPFFVTGGGALNSCLIALSSSF